MGSYRVNRTTSRATSRMQMDSGVDAARDSFVPDLSKGIIAVRRHTENDGQKKKGNHRDLFFSRRESRALPFTFFDERHVTFAQRPSAKLVCGSRGLGGW